VDVCGVGPGHRDSESATPSSLQGSEETRLQVQSKRRVLIKDELKGATYYVDLTTTEDGILHADPRAVEAVIDNLGTTFQALTSGGDLSATDPRFPIDGFSHEFQSYEPLVHLLNKITDTANRYTPRIGTSAGSTIVSATPSSLPDAQSKMKALIEDQLRGATYHVDLTTKGGILHSDPRIVEAVQLFILSVRYSVTVI